MATKISRIHLKDFTVFSDLNLPLVDGINIFAGENGAGKSHVLKAMYSVLSASEPARDTLAVSPESQIASKLVGVFRPESLGRLVRRRPGRGRAEVDVQFTGPRQNISFSFATNSRSEVNLSGRLSRAIEGTPVYLPTRELLTIYPGFVSLYERTTLEFEESWRDTCILLGLPLSRGPRQDRVRGLLAPLEESLGGSVAEEGGRFYLRVTGGGKYEMPLVAEGMRKLAMLARLIANGTLFESGFLFWDEPEANLNPRVLRHVARTIAQLARSGVQVFVGTHSLYLMKELEILKRMGDPSFPALQFVTLSKGSDGVRASSGEYLEELDDLAILDESLAQSDRFLDAIAE
ncbi:AAA domain-containing protein, putative AbiEii toxin, Type IV TA system [Rathayibacter oskolensis]|uniref:AAA domain-containing protein, putative AbiEii toxin, Type IV TA system n=1 Tax=Rathayibacter oskolensis TaxID=1891671 RepID=A0A1X7PH44_9MICO|nr:AAA family ATPase [Rathayibacter oskolensis]SMH49877.1 AAA domain-containing protein, putative AbiEii toxin, Type IV TA system [Rathayibacter oskolensis]